MAATKTAQPLLSSTTIPLMLDEKAYIAHLEQRLAAMSLANTTRDQQVEQHERQRDAEQEAWQKRFEARFEKKLARLVDVLADEAQSSQRAMRELVQQQIDDIVLPRVDEKLMNFERNMENIQETLDALIKQHESNIRLSYQNLNEQLATRAMHIQSLVDNLAQSSAENIAAQAHRSVEELTEKMQQVVSLVENLQRQTTENEQSSLRALHDQQISLKKHEQSTRDNINALRSDLDKEISSAVTLAANTQAGLSNTMLAVDALTKGDRVTLPRLLSLANRLHECEQQQLKYSLVLQHLNDTSVQQTATGKNEAELSTETVNTDGSPINVRHAVQILTNATEIRLQQMDKRLSDVQRSMSLLTLQTASHDALLTQIVGHRSERKKQPPSSGCS